MTALQYAQELIEFDSVSYRSNADVSDHVERILQRLDFETEVVQHTDARGVSKTNVMAKRGEGSGGLAYFGHTDVVPAEDWFDPSGSPFKPVVRDGRLYGRGSTDMKGSIACMLAAAERLPAQSQRSPIYISCTADEEIDHRGAREISARSNLYRQLVEGQACGIVGEATDLQVVYAHKGGCRFSVLSKGRAAHSSTREGVNANLAMIPFLSEMRALHLETEQELRWQNDEFDPPTLCVNIGINDHNRATNITAPQSICTVAFRPMPGTATEELLERARRQADQFGLEFRVEVMHQPFRTDPDSKFVQTARQLTGDQPPKTVSYGTEASNLAGIRDLVVLGPGNIGQAHTRDEWIELDQLERGTDVYSQFIERYCL